ncbi:unnamed protein product [Schistosoma curassoni]|uniref:Uncharacterized protein n=1 Tax=Schistosoma curassoni TaxID=6186 RepID=A0A183KIY1_9TREM|nr:unnamed protein product [Schistosoma curassoni]
MTNMRFFSCMDRHNMTFKLVFTYEAATTSVTHMFWFFMHNSMFQK